MDQIAVLEAWKSIVGSTYEIEPMPRVHTPLWRIVAESGRAYVLRRLPDFPPGAGPVRRTASSPTCRPPAYQWHRRS